MGQSQARAWHDIYYIIISLYDLHRFFSLSGYVIGDPDFILIDLEISNIGSNANFAHFADFSP